VNGEDKIYFYSLGLADIKLEHIGGIFLDTGTWMGYIELERQDD
jgi:hypothetical protein